MIDSLKSKKITPSQIASLVLLVIAGLVSLNIYQKQNKKIVQLRRLHQEQEKKNQILLRIGDLNKEINSYKERLGPKDRRVIINKITNIARTSGVEIIALKPQQRGQATKSKIYGKVFFDVDIQADSYHRLGEFLGNLESDPSIFVVESLTLQSADARQSSGSEGAPGGMNLDAQLTISQLFFKQ